MKRHGGKRKPGMKYGGQNVLAGVLLHVIEAALPVNNSLHQAKSDGLVDEVDYFVFFVEDVYDPRVSEATRVVWLAAGSWVKRGEIEFYTPQCAGHFQRGSLRRSCWRSDFSRLWAEQQSGDFRFAAQNLRGKFPRKRVIVIAAFSGHLYIGAAFLYGVFTKMVMVATMLYKGRGVRKF
jgi:hypothetical protein